MTIIPANGKNQRLGQLFKTPKQNLLYQGRPAIERTKEYMSQFGEVAVVKLDHETANQVETIVNWILTEDNILKGSFWVVDCDVVPVKLNKPKINTVYVFRPQSEVNQYSNFSVNEDSYVEECNEKGKRFDYCGAGIYFFLSPMEFLDNSYGKQSCAEVIAAMIERGHYFKADTTSEIFRFGTLHDITGL